MSEVLISDLKSLAKSRDQQAIIAFCVERDGTVRCVTYGEDKLKCDAAGWWGQGFLDKEISAIPFQTVFGMNNNGAALPLSPSDENMINSLYSDAEIPYKFYMSEKDESK